MSAPATPPSPPPTPTWWVWFDRLLEEWFYIDHNPDQIPGLALQLKGEKTQIHQVQAVTGVQAIEAVCPGYKDARRPDPFSAPPRQSPRLN